MSFIATGKIKSTDFQGPILQEEKHINSKNTHKHRHFPRKATAKTPVLPVFSHRFLAFAQAVVDVPLAAAADAAVMARAGARQRAKTPRPGLVRKAKVGEV